MRGQVKIERTVPLVTPELVLEAYAEGLFPMAESREDARIYWIDPDWRAIFPMDRFHVPRRLKRTLRRRPFEICVDTAFDRVITACAAHRRKQKETWISRRIATLYSALHRMGYAHSVECWRNGALVGGLYGVALGAAFFGESMFSRERDASKVALVHVHERLKERGFTLFDVQFWTEHLAQFGAIEVSRSDYLARLRGALDSAARF